MNKKKNRTVQNTENLKKQKEQKEKLRKEQVMTAAFLLYGESDGN